MLTVVYDAVVDDVNVTVVMYDVVVVTVVVVNITDVLSCPLMRLDSVVTGTSVVVCVAGLIGRGIRHVWSSRSLTYLDTALVRSSRAVHGWYVKRTDIGSG